MSETAKSSQFTARARSEPAEGGGGERSRKRAGGQGRKAPLKPNSTPRTVVSG